MSHLNHSFFGNQSPNATAFELWLPPNSPKGVGGKWHKLFYGVTILTLVIIIWLKNKKVTIKFYDSLCFDKDFGSSDQFIYILNDNSLEEFNSLIKEYIYKFYLFDNSIKNLVFYYKINLN